MLAAVLADIVFNSLSQHSLMTEKLARRGVVVPRRYAPDVLQVHSVREAMTTGVETLPEDAAIADARAACSRTAATAHTRWWTTTSRSRGS